MYTLLHNHIKGAKIDSYFFPKVTQFFFKRDFTPNVNVGCQRSMSFLETANDTSLFCTHHKYQEKPEQTV